MGYRNRILTVAIIAIVGSSCNDRKTTGGTASAVRTDSSVAQKASNIRDVGLTLPILDALFFEDGFESELSSKLHLTGQEIQKLKNAARTATAGLTEDGADYETSARAAATKSDRQVKNILGQQRAEQLYAFIAERYSSGDVQALFPTQPNSIPKDTRIVVNAPAFRMDVFQDGRLTKTYRVGIGYPEFPLPVGMRRADNIIFNPTWTPPDEPWVKGKVQAGKKVAAGSKLNPLGPIKIPIGMPSLIHGGKAVSRLGNFASHGCVGLTSPQVQDFALVLAQLSGSSISQDSIQAFERQRTKTKSVKLDKAIPVELRYETIVAENGSLHIYRDVYERGTNTQDNAERVLAVYGIKYASLSEQEKQLLADALNEMNKDMHGAPIAGNSTSNDTGAADTKTVAGDDKEKRAKKGKVTSSVVGQKEMTVPIVALQAKGYPQPVNYDMGTAGK